MGVILEQSILCNTLCDNFLCFLNHNNHITKQLEKIFESRFLFTNNNNIFNFELNRHESDKTETITFRLKSSLINELKNEANSENITANSLVTKIISNHLQWERYERKVGLLPMTKPFLNEILQKLSEGDVIEIAKTIEKRQFLGIMSFIMDIKNVQDFIKILRSWLTVSWMQHTIDNKSDGNAIFKIQHDLGIKWSIYIKTLISELYLDIFKERIEISWSENNIFISFKK